MIADESRREMRDDGCESGVDGNESIPDDTSFSTKIARTSKLKV